MKFQFCSSENGLIINKKDSLIRGHISQKTIFSYSRIEIGNFKKSKGS